MNFTKNEMYDLSAYIAGATLWALSVGTTVNYMVNSKPDEYLLGALFLAIAGDSALNVSSQYGKLSKLERELLKSD